MVDEQQRVAWFGLHQELMDELSGRVRRRRSSRAWLLGGLAAALFLGLLVWGWLSEDLSRTVPTPLWVIQVRFGVLGCALLLMALALVLGTRRSGSLGVRRSSWAASPGRPAQRRMVALIRSADPSRSGVRVTSPVGSPRRAGPASSTPPRRW